MLRSIPVKILFKYQRIGSGGYTFKCNKNEKYTVHSFLWLFPWATEIIGQIHYLQIDGSCRALPDYSFCLWHGIYYNETIPFALSVYPTEKFELFNILFECCRFYKIDENGRDGSALIITLPGAPIMQKGHMATSIILLISAEHLTFQQAFQP